MGCCQSSFLKPSSLHLQTSHHFSLRLRKRSKRNLHHSNNNEKVSCDGGGWDFSSVPHFSEFFEADLRAATNNFDISAVVSICSDKAPNVVYEGRLKRDGDIRRIAVKRFLKSSWPDPMQFAAEARAIGKMRHMRLVNLIGYCCDGDERLLVSEFMPNETLTKHLFHWENQTLDWAMRLRIALYAAEALEYCRQSGHQLYHDFNACRVLFDENGNPRLSSFGLMKNSKDGKNFSTNLAFTAPEYLRSGTLIPESVVFSFGTFLLDLLSGKHVPPGHAVDAIQKQNLLVLMDSHLEGNYPKEEAAMVFDLASKCLQKDPTDRPEIKDIVVKLSALQHKLDIPSYDMLGTSKVENPEAEKSNSVFYDACYKMDLAAVHQILEATDYKDDDVTCELSFQQWSQQIKDVWNTRQQGDLAFRNTDFQSAIEKYTQFIETGTMISPTVYARRSICHLFCDQPDAALRDAMQAQCVYPDWPTALYLQALALSKLNMLQDSATILREASILEDKRKGKGS